MWFTGNSDPIDFGSVMLNSQTQSSWLYEITFGNTTPDQCKNTEQYTYKISGTLTGNHEQTLDTQSSWLSRPNYNQIKITA